MRADLELRAAHQAVDASRVTLTVRDKPVGDVLEEVSRQTGNRIVDFRKFRGQPRHNPSIRLDLQEVPFWQALDTIFDQAGLAAYPYAIDDRGAPLRGVAFVNRTEKRAADRQRIGYQGAFRFEPLQVITRRGLRDPLPSGLELEVEVAWEPRLKPLSLKVLYDSFQGTDDTGQPLTPEVKGEREIELQSGAVGRFSLRYRLPDPQARQLRNLRGKIEGLIPGGRATFRFDQLGMAEGQQQQRGGATVTLQHVRKIKGGPDPPGLPEQPPGGSIWEVRVRVRFETSGVPLESHLMEWITENEARLVDSTGKTIAWSTMEKTREVADEFGIAYLFGLEGEIDGYAFHYTTPVALLKKQIPLEFPELPLP
ncbi:MAG: hypothetical protein GTO03_10435 [Planctomycetales bacterium]|nr:hypothetical protein [Planctomycetales bacterium]